MQHRTGVSSAKEGGLLSLNVGDIVWVFALELYLLYLPTVGTVVPRCSKSLMMAGAVVTRCAGWDEQSSAVGCKRLLKPAEDGDENTGWFPASIINRIPRGSPGAPNARLLHLLALRGDCVDDDDDERSISCAGFFRSRIRLWFLRNADTALLCLEEKLVALTCLTCGQGLVSARACFPFFLPARALYTSDYRAVASPQARLAARLSKKYLSLECLDQAKHRKVSAAEPSMFSESLPPAA